MQKWLYGIVFLFYFVSQSTFEMKNKREPIQQLNDIRSFMERSSRFISLSGLSGVSAGVIALIGAGIAWLYLDLSYSFINIDTSLLRENNLTYNDIWQFIIADAIIVLILAITAGIFFTTRRARKKGLKVWDSTAKRLVVNLLIPLMAGGLFCIVLFYHHLVFLIAPASLIFYGLALINASKYTLHEIKILGLSEVALGLIASLLPGYGLIFWSAGFGLLHIIYGLVMYFRYETLPEKD